MYVCVLVKAGRQIINKEKNKMEGCVLSSSGSAEVIARSGEHVVNFVFLETRGTFLRRATIPEGLCYVQLVIYLRPYSKMFYKK
jgi:hypothetical protein